VPGECGALASFADAQAYVRIAVELAGDPSRTERLRVNARLAAERIDWASVNNAFVAALAHYAGLPQRRPLRRQ
jgi:hypothetical protein